MDIRVVENEADLDNLEEGWNELAERITAPIFSQYDYIRTAWKHFKKPTDQLFIIVISDGASIRGIGPFYVERKVWRGLIPYRSLRFIADWEGDRPSILSQDDMVLCFKKIFDFLNHKRHAWDMIELAEQPKDGPEGKGWSFLSRTGWYWEQQLDAIDYYIVPQGSWDDYLKSLKGKVRSNLRRQIRRLEALPEGIEVEMIADTHRIVDALRRFVALEKLSWKAAANIGTSKNNVHMFFYEDLLSRLAKKGNVQIYFLKSNKEDLAGAIHLSCHGITYGRHTAYSPKYATYSPAVILHSKIFQAAFEESFYEIDLLGLKESGKDEKHKTDWANGTRETVKLSCYQINSRVFPLILSKHLKCLMFGFNEKPK